MSLPAPLESFDLEDDFERGACADMLRDAGRDDEAQGLSLGNPVAIRDGKVICWPEDWADYADRTEYVDSDEVARWNEDGRYGGEEKVLFVEERHSRIGSQSCAIYRPDVYVYIDGTLSHQDDTDFLWTFSLEEAMAAARAYAARLGVLQEQQ